MTVTTEGETVNKEQATAFWIIAVALWIIATSLVILALNDDGGRIDRQTEAIERQTTAIRATCVANARTRVPSSFTPQAFDAELQLILTVCMSDASALSDFAENALNTIGERMTSRADP